MLIHDYLQLSPNLSTYVLLSLTKSDPDVANHRPELSGPKHPKVPEDKNFSSKALPPILSETTQKVPSAVDA